MIPLSVGDYELLALEKLERMVGDYYRSGARDEITLAENRAAFARHALRHRVLVDVSARTMARSVLGLPLTMPILAAPTAFHKLAHPEGEVASAAGTGRAGTAFCLSTLSNTAIEDVIAQTAAPVFFQLYVYRDRGASKALIERVVAAGAKAIVLTVDAPLLGTRERDVRNLFRLPPDLEMPNATAEPYRVLGARPNDSALAAWVAENLDPSLSWSDLDWLRKVARVPIVLKGIVRADDAVRAVDAGVAAIVVSNHGGRQLDSEVATLDALPEVVDAVAGRCEVLMDGGIRRGTDVLKAIALGAHAVLVGRPILWGLAVAGAEGVESVLRILQRELDEAMALTGAPTLDAITRDLLVGQKA